MVKSGEQYNQEEMIYDDKGFLTNTSNRPRLISNPSDSMLGFTSAAVIPMLQTFRDIDKSFIYKYDNSQLIE